MSLGLIHQVVDDGQVAETAEGHGARMASYPEGSARQIKEEIRSRQTIDPESWFAHEPSPALLTAKQLRQ